MIAITARLTLVEFADVFSCRGQGAGSDRHTPARHVCPYIPLVAHDVVPGMLMPSKTVRYATSDVGDSGRTGRHRCAWHLHWSTYCDPSHEERSR